MFIKSYTDHSNRQLDLTVTDPGLPAAIKFLAEAHMGRDFNGEDPFRRASKRMCLAYRMSTDRTGVYLQAMCVDDDELDEPGWTKLQPGLCPGKAAAKIRKLLRDVPKPASDHDGFAEDGWEILDPMAVALMDDDEEPDDFVCAFSYVKPYICEYAK